MKLYAVNSSKIYCNYKNDSNNEIIKSIIYLYEKVR